MGRAKSIGSGSGRLPRRTAAAVVFASLLAYNTLSMMRGFGEFANYYYQIAGGDASPPLSSAPAGARGGGGAPTSLNRSNSNADEDDAPSSLLRRFEERIRRPGDDARDAFAPGRRPFLVVCHEVDNSLSAAFVDFAVVKLRTGGTTPPPFNATEPVFLHGEQCADHPYVKEAHARRKRAPYLVATNLSAPAEEGDKGREEGTWLNGVHWPNFSANSAKYYLRVIHERPAIVKRLGEVFWGMHYAKQSHHDADFTFYREVETPLPDTLTIHFVQGVTTAMMRGEEGEFGFENTMEILERRAPHPHQRASPGNYSKFCSFMVRYNSSNPILMFNSTFYDTDALVRHMFFMQLSEYKPCTRVTDCPGGPYTSFECMVGYKFHITMENSNVEGYVSEKLFNGALAGGIPIYFGANDVGKYVNERSFVHCMVNKTVIDEMRSFYPRTTRPRPWMFKYSSSWPTDAELLRWADGYLRPQLEPCVNRIIELDKNDAEYMKVLKEPFIVDRNVMSGRYPMQGVELAYNLLRSRGEALGGEDFDTIESIP